MGLAVIILPDDAELNHTLRDLDDIKSLLILGVRLEERLKRLSELVESLEISPLRQGILIVISEKSTANLLKLGFDWEDHCDCSKRGFESRKRQLMMIPHRAFCWAFLYSERELCVVPAESLPIGFRPLDDR